MNVQNRILEVLALLVVSILFTSAIHAQSALTDDAHTSTAPKSINSNFGSSPNLTLSSANDAYIKFRLSSTLPPNTTKTDVVKAALKLFIGNVSTPGKIDVYQVAGTWNEATVTANNAPILGGLLVTSAQIDTTMKGKFLVLDLTGVVQQWLGDDGQGTNGAPNYGIVLKVHPLDADTPTLAHVTFDSKENSQTSHEPQLIIQRTSSAAGGISTVEHDQTLAGYGTTSDPLGIAPGGVGNTQLADGSITSPKIANGQVVKSLNNLADDVVIAAGSNVSITPSANTLTIATTGLLSGVSHDATLAGDGTAATPLGVSAMGIGTVQLANGAVTAPKLAVPLALSSADPGFTLSVENAGAGQAITASGPINTSTQYNIGGQHMLSARGDLNTFAGQLTAPALTTGFRNSFFGNAAGQGNTGGHHNSFFGYRAGLQNTTGSLNTFFGSFAGQSNTDEIGNTFIGYNSHGDPGVMNATALGAGAVVTESGAVVLGHVNATVAIGATAPKAKLHVEGGNILVGSAGFGIILKAQNNTTCRLLRIDNAGALTLTPIACP